MLTPHHESNIAEYDGPPTEGELEELRKRGRRDAVIVMVLSTILLGINHYMAMSQGRFYPKLVFGGAMIATVGVFGLFRPLIMTRHLPVGKHYPKSVLLWMLLACAAGALAAWPLYTWYHG